MRQQQCWYQCDREGCDETSPPEVDWRWANRSALTAGWWLVGFDRAPTALGESHLCPAHRPTPS